MSTISNTVFTKPHYSLNNYPRQSGYLLFLVMMSLNVMLCSGVLTHRLIQLGPIYTMAGTLVAPLWFTLSDIIAEVYGYRVARKIVWFGFICQATFAITCNLLIKIPSPNFLDNKAAYSSVLGSILPTCLSAMIAYFIAGFINIYFISKWKILLRGRYFWLRSLGATVISAFIFTLLAVFLIQYGALPLRKILIIISVSYSLKIVYAIILAFPANLFASAIKKAEGVDIYDHGINYNPFKFSD